MKTYTTIESWKKDWTPAIQSNARLKKGASPFLCIIGYLLKTIYNNEI